MESSVSAAAVTSVASPVAPSRTRVSFPDLDGLRFVAFAAVYLQHGLYNVVHGSAPTLGRIVFLRGWDGVCLFFVLSGFLITYLALTEQETHGQLDVPSFYVRRALRIWPLHVASLLVVFGVLPLLQRHPTDARLGPFLWFAGNFEVLRTASLGLVAPMVLKVMWSVAIEEQFYLVWPLVLRTLVTRALPWLCGAVAILSAVYRANVPFLDATFHTLGNVGYLALGALAACLLRRPDVAAKVTRWPRSLIVGGYAAGLTTFVFAPAANLALSLFYTFVVVEQCFCQRSLFKMSRFRTVSRLGTYTYGLYLLHPYPLTFGPKIFHNEWVVGIAGLALSLVLAIASYELFERRFLALKQRFATVLR